MDAGPVGLITNPKLSPVHRKLLLPDSRFPIPDSRFPITYPLFPAHSQPNQ
ncbi:MAG: hypothetical protein F6J94_08900 [Moorea sp. SIO1F2]|uniref:hypothetical protein n=1 Tax=Moorena sp. SIO1F2 TaxID=2607819 RepID=UPI0013BD44B1|nr:hypothetical protein [Moorena sp. SIO1F2]NET82051.1 hypothetical protein [Moorena sp. SIO1F2]